jgi:hypothetical protein
LVQKNQFPELNQHFFHLFAKTFTVWSHILSTGGDALTCNVLHFKELYV